MSLSESIKEATSITTRGMFQFACDARDQFKKKFRRSRNFSRALPVTEISI